MYRSEIAEGTMVRDPESTPLFVHRDQHFYPPDDDPLLRFVRNPRTDLLPPEASSSSSGP